jgi:hypothetical protein
MSVRLTVCAANIPIHLIVAALRCTALLSSLRLAGCGKWSAHQDQGQRFSWATTRQSQVIRHDYEVLPKLAYLIYSP